jgi:hypothetical protein
MGLVLNCFKVVIQTMRPRCRQKRRRNDDDREDRFTLAEIGGVSEYAEESSDEGVCRETSVSSSRGLGHSLTDRYRG